MSENNDLGPLYDARHAKELESSDRERPIPGGEPICPVCGSRTVRQVESHPAPRSDDSPFRVRLVCSNDECRRWTVYNW